MTTLQKIITFPSCANKFRMCLHEKYNAANTSERKPGERPGFGGLESTLVQAIVDNLGVEFDFYVPDDDGFGFRLKNGSWTGCPGMVQRNETDIAVGAMLQNYWSNIFAYTTVSYSTEEVRFVTKLPEPITKPEVIIKIFDTDLWLTIFAFIFLVGVVSYWMHGKKYSVVDHCFSRFVELLLQEPCIKIEKKFSQEILCLFWNIATLFLTLSYMAVVLGLMMMPKRPPPLDTDDKLLDAVKAGKYKAATPSDLKMYLQNLRQSPVSKYQELGDIIFKNNWILEINRENFATLLKNDYAIASAIFTQKIYGSSDAEMVISKEFIYQANLCSLLSKNFPLAKKMDRIMTRMVEHGLYAREMELFLFEARLKFKENAMLKTQLARALTLDDLQGTFILFGTGHGIATVVLIYEFIKFWFNEKNKKQGLENKQMESAVTDNNFEEITELD